MNKWMNHKTGSLRWSLAILALIGCGSVLSGWACAQSADFSLHGNDIQSGGTLPVKYTCDGSSEVPEVSWSGAPKGTESFALVMHHEVSATDVHVYWVVYNIDKTVSHVGKNTGTALMGVNTVDNQPQYTPPCSKGPGVKQYEITLYALSARPDLSPSSKVTGAALWDAIKDITLASTDLTFTYDRTGIVPDAPTPPGAGGQKNSSGQGNNSQKNSGTSSSKTASGSNARCQVIRKSVSDAGFAADVSVSCDDQYAYLTSDTYPDHELMNGITGSNEQVPVPALDYAAPIKLNPQPAAQITTIDAAVGVAVNGVPIYDYSSQGELDPYHYDASADTYLQGQLDNCGGHAGRGDDYHYHKSPNCMIDAMANKGDAAIIGWGYDGYPLYGNRNPDGSQIASGTLDVCNGQPDATFGYRYHTSDSAPYIIQCLTGQVDTSILPRVHPLSGDSSGIRADLRPPRDGVSKLRFSKAGDGSRTMRYEYQGKSYFTTYKPSASREHCYDFEQKTISNGGKLESGTFCRQSGEDEQPNNRPGGGSQGNSRDNPRQSDNRQPDNRQALAGNNSGTRNAPPAGSDSAAQNSTGPGNGPSKPRDIQTVELSAEVVASYGKALVQQVQAGDGNGIDKIFRNSGVLIDDSSQTYYAVNGVHPVLQGEYTRYYPKSIVQASLKDDSLVHAWRFSQVRGHDIDMEALTFGPDKNSIYIGDEYNYIYQMSLADGSIQRQWSLADIGVHTRVDKGIEAMTYSAKSGYFYVGIQDTDQLLALTLNPDESLSKVAQYPIPRDWSASGLYADNNGRLLVLAMEHNGQQAIFQYDADGHHQCDIRIPKALNIVRVDGISLDASGQYLYLADSQGPLYGGQSLYKVRWDNPCGS